LLPEPLAAPFVFLQHAANRRCPMAHVIYRIVKHDGGWAYQVNGVFSEPFPTHAKALTAARLAAAEQRVPGHTEAIEWEDESGRWHSETASGSDRPATEVKDSAS
jgi:hypothetical protein